MNVNEAMEMLRNAPVESLAEWAYESHKDFYGFKGRHMIDYSKEELVEWIKSHFTWDESTQCWNNSVPFIGE